MQCIRMWNAGEILSPTVERIEGEQDDASFAVASCCAESYARRDSLPRSRWSLPDNVNSSPTCQEGACHRTRGIGLSRGNTVA